MNSLNLETLTDVEKIQLNYCDDAKCAIIQLINSIATGEHSINEAIHEVLPFEWSFDGNEKVLIQKVIEATTGLKAE